MRISNIILRGISGACLGHHLGHVCWGNIRGMSGESSGACLGQYVNNGQQSAVLHAVFGEKFKNTLMGRSPTNVTNVIIYVLGQWRKVPQPVCYASSKAGYLKRRSETRETIATSVSKSLDIDDIYTDYKMTKMMMVIKMRRGWSEYQRESRKWM